MSINVIAESITLQRCKQLLFLHVLSGSDYSSRYSHVRKVKFWISWLVSQIVPERIICLDDCPSSPLREEDINVIERLIISLCWDDFTCFSIDLARYEIFKHRPKYVYLTKDVSLQHAHKSTCVSGHIWGRSNLRNKTD